MAASFIFILGYLFSLSLPYSVVHMYFDDQAKVTPARKNLYIAVSTIIGILFFLYWGVIHWAKPEAVSLIDDYVEYEEPMEEVPEDELEEMNEIN